MKLRSLMEKRYWHIGLFAIVAVIIFGIVDLVFLSNQGTLPGLKEIWWLAVLMPMVCGALVTLGCGGVSLSGRMIGAAVCGGLVGMFSTILSLLLSSNSGIFVQDIVVNGIWKVFIFSIFSLIGATLTELKLPDPDLFP